MLDTSILINMIEAERNKIDQKHRSVECDRLAYGIIYRVLDAVYAAKCEAERVAYEASLTPEQRAELSAAATAPTLAPKGDYTVPFQTSRGLKLYGRYALVSTLVNGIIMSNCVYCNDSHPGRSVICKKEPCQRRLKTDSQRARNLGKTPEPITPRAPIQCLNCKQMIRAPKGRQVVCTKVQNPDCFRQTNTFETSVYATKRLRGGRPETESQYKAWNFMKLIEETRKANNL